MIAETLIVTLPQEEGNSLGTCYNTTRMLCALDMVKCEGSYKPGKI